MENSKIEQDTNFYIKIDDQCNLTITKVINCTFRSERWKIYLTAFMDIQNPVMMRSIDMKKIILSLSFY